MAQDSDINEILYKYDGRIQTDLVKIKSIDAKTYEDIKEFIRRLQSNNYSKARILKYIYSLWIVRMFLGKGFRETSKQDIENLIIKINSSKYAESTKADLKKMLKFYYRWLKLDKFEGNYPDEVAWIKTTVKKNNEKVPEQILTVEEIEALASKSENLMKRAFVLCIYETGCRISEFLNIRIKNINFDQYGSFILVSGKTGWRRVRVIDYSKDLMKWLDVHPFKTTPESYVWINPKNQQRIYPDDANHLLKDLAIKSGITKAVNPHAFRHARATHLARILREQQLKVYFGWAKDSGMASIYVHLSGEDVDNSLLEAKGIKIDKEKQAMSPTTRICQKCGENNSILSHFCKKCNFPLDLRIMFEIDEHRKKFDEFLKDFLVYYAEKDKSFKKAFAQFVKERKAEDLFGD